MAKKRKMARGTAQKGGNPPKHTQFRKGTSGNPRGRPKGSKNLSTYLMEAARDHITATVGGRTRTISKLQATTMQLATKAAGAIRRRPVSCLTGLTKSKPVPPMLSRASSRSANPISKSSGRSTNE